ncbi:MAG: hypothetical protein K6B75_02715 [Lachnospiraceae bacterium]|nr:hypothetical protein [Lachnospiraceae bacterium]
MFPKKIPKKQPIKSISPKDEKKYSSFRKGRRQNASLTAEASLVFPFFFFFFYMLWQCFLLLLLQISVCNKALDCTTNLGGLGYVSTRAAEKSDELFEYIYKADFYSEVAKSDNTSQIRIICEKNEDKSFKIRVKYTYNFISPFYVKIRIPIVQAFVTRPYFGMGKKVESEADEYVYVTKNGTVYHTSLSCPHIAVNLREVCIDELAVLRNAKGQKYTKCAICGSHINGNKVYISPFGERYHSSPYCNAIKRKIYKKKRGEVGDLLPCSKCGKE